MLSACVGPQVDGEILVAAWVGSSSIPAPGFSGHRKAVHGLWFQTARPCGPHACCPTSGHRHRSTIRLDFCPQPPGESPAAGPPPPDCVSQSCTSAVQVCASPSTCIPQVASLCPQGHVHILRGGLQSRPWRAGHCMSSSPHISPQSADDDARGTAGRNRSRSC